MQMDGNFRYNRWNEKLGVPPKIVRLFRKFPFDLHVPFTFQAFHSKILAKSKALLDLLPVPFSLILMISILESVNLAKKAGEVNKAASDSERN